MYPIGITEARRWRNVSNGRTASVYGSVPWTSDAGRADWRMETCGFTLEMSNGTIGCGRVPFETREEAIAFANDWLNRIGRAPLTLQE